MAITAATSSYDRIIRSSANNGKSLFEDGKAGVSSSSTWYQGDLLCYDTSSNILRVVAATSDAATFVGIADNQVASGVLYGPYQGLTPVDAAQKSPGFVGPKYGVSANMIANTGDTFVFGAKVYLLNGGTTQQVTVTDPGDHNYIGIYVGSGLTSAAAGALVPCLLGARYPAASAAGLNF
jgi:hypothetical protein